METHRRPASHPATTTCANGSGATASYYVTTGTPHYSSSDLQTLNVAVPGAPHFSYTYTNVHELQTETGTNGNFVWQPSSTNSSTAYTPNILNQYTSIGAQTSGGTDCAGTATQGLSYDCNGNLTYDGTFSYGYDAENRLTSACTPTPCTSPTVNAAYEYDPLGRRTRKSGTGVTERYFLSDGTDEIAEYDSGRHIAAYYIPGPAIDQPVAMVTGTAGAYLHTYFNTNRQGSVIATTEDRGQSRNSAYSIATLLLRQSEPYDSGEGCIDVACSNSKADGVSCAAFEFFRRCIEECSSRATLPIPPSMNRNYGRCPCRYEGVLSRRSSLQYRYLSRLENIERRADSIPRFKQARENSARCAPICTKHGFGSKEEAF